MSNESLLSLRVRSISEEALGIHAYELVSNDERPLPAFSAGAHVSLVLPDGMQRSYSLTNSQRERHRYVVAVNLDPRSRGGSRYLHQRVRVGDVLPAVAPRNAFELAEDARQSVFIAGGIGITPIYAMIRRLNDLGKRWALHYCARTPRAAAFTAELAGDERVRFYFDETEPADRLDIANLVGGLPPHAHVYCCGPASMLDAFLAATSRLSTERVHYERFAAAPAPARNGSYTVTLARSGRTVPVRAGQTILQVLQEAGLEPAFSCGQGVCGSCETAVLAGRPDHRDQVLSEDERASGSSMMICCSGCLDDNLVLDL
ncbi:2Fe-2S iron-sulfur cluster binding domain-containing protein [Bordetella petrii]|nr:2Fe-2S iron-sulfur cluster binding domain-containing protein [Bordetella petrii]